MAHELSFKNGKAELVLADTGAWHKLGTVFDTSQHIIDSKTAMAIACPWHAIKETLYIDRGNSLIPTSQIALMRSDTQAIIGYASNTYVPIQPEYMFSWTDAVLGEPHPGYESAGALKGGSVLFLTARLGEINILGSGDRTRTYLTFMNSFDGSISAQAFLTGTRIVCMNTLKMSLGDKKSNTVKFRHTKNIESRLERTSQVMALALSTQADLQAKLESLAQRQLTKDLYMRVLDELFPGEKTRTANVKLAITSIFNSNDGDFIPEFKNTAYNLYNSVTNYVDHDRAVRLTKSSTASDSSMQRAESAILGSGAELKEKALDTILILTSGAAIAARDNKYFDMKPVLALPGGDSDVLDVDYSVVNN
jgi:phage/plasmid-like protein (TIGR03299 family)